MNKTQIIEKFRERFTHRSSGRQWVCTPSDVLSFILEVDTQAREEERKKAINMLTVDIKAAEFIDDGYKRWNKGLTEGRGVEPCYECENRDKTIAYLKKGQTEQR